MSVYGINITRLLFKLMMPYTALVGKSPLSTGREYAYKCNLMSLLHLS